MFRMKIKNLTSVFSLASSLYLNVGIYLLKFGKVSQYVDYSALSDYFSSMELRLKCSNSHFRMQQEKYQTRSTSDTPTQLTGGEAGGGGRGCGT